MEGERMSKGLRILCLIVAAMMVLGTLLSIVLGMF